MLPDVLLFTSSACPHCPGVKAGLQTLLNEGAIATLDMADAVSDPRAAEWSVRSVPWFRIGLLQFDGAMTLGDLRTWAQRAATREGVRQYCFDMLKSGQRGKVEDLIRREPTLSAVLAELAFDAEAGMETRLGVGAVLEELQGGEFTEAMVPALVAHLAGTDSRQRADAAHFLSLIGGEAVQDALRPYLDDPDPEVRDIAREALA